jgi:hypothetical protein
MRISPISGDQWPAAALLHPLPPAEPTATAPPTHAVVQAAAAASADHRQGEGSERQHDGHAVFDPPLIAQRAVLGLPVGTQIADYAKAHDLPFTTVAHAVDMAMPADRAGAAGLDRAGAPAA